ncbi:endolytic transglycosylase MltG [candidate division KSB1 bacterium]|nr:endolytic transglycosylase MltG [candidate division KSB1 bacterium]
MNAKSFGLLTFFGFLGGLFLVVGATYLGGVIFLPPGKGVEEGFQVVRVKPGMTVSQTARILKEKGLVESKDRFILSAKLLGWEADLKPGDHSIPHGLSPYGVLSLLLEEGAETKDITLPEGLMAREIASLLKAGFDVDSVEFMQRVQDTALCRDLGVNAKSLEGYLFPDTYNFYRHMVPGGIIRRMVARFWQVFSDTLIARAQLIGLAVHEAVTLASIIQGEVIVPGEGSLVSAVYHNRLKMGMRLQADPTIQYILKDGPRRLLQDDLWIPSPYNTYRHRGLPPGPINNPGEAALRTALFPADVDYLYFVARGDGSHVFSCTNQEHLRAKRRLNRLRRELKRKKSQGLIE